MPAKGSTGTTRRAPLRVDCSVKLYGPTAAKPYFRVVAMGQVERASAPVPMDLLGTSEKVKFVLDRLDPTTARARREADELFDQMVRWAKHQTTPVKHGDRTLNALCDRRLIELRDKGRAMTTIEQNESLMRLYVRPVIGQVNVADWNTEHSLAVLRKARETCGAERVADVGKVLRCLVTLAHRKPTWLSRDEDPMEGVEFRVTSQSQAEGVHFVAIKNRPSTDQVDTLAAAMQEVGLETMRHLAGRPTQPVIIDRGWGWLTCQVMGRCGTRFGEAMSLTVSSVARTREEVESAIEEDLSLSPAERVTRKGAIIAIDLGLRSTSC